MVRASFGTEQAQKSSDADRLLRREALYQLKKSICRQIVESFHMRNVANTPNLQLGAWQKRHKELQNRKEK